MQAAAGSDLVDHGGGGGRLHAGGTGIPEDGEVRRPDDAHADAYPRHPGRPRRAVKGLGPDRPVLVGFAAETGDVVHKAREKRARKQVDLIVANDVSRADRGFDVDTNAVTIVDARGEEIVPLQSKAEVAAAILDRVEALVSARRRAGHAGAAAPDPRRSATGNPAVPHDTLADHLTFFEELGVEGVRLDAAWRARAVPDAVASGRPAWPGPTTPRPAPSEPAYRLPVPVFANAPRRSRPYA